jgi:hypothetical protein
MRQPRHLNGGRVGIGRVRVRHRLDDDRVAATHFHAADVNGDRKSPWAETLGAHR